MNVTGPDLIIIIINIYLLYNLKFAPLSGVQTSVFNKSDQASHYEYGWSRFKTWAPFQKHGTSQSSVIFEQTETDREKKVCVTINLLKPTGYGMHKQVEHFNNCIEVFCICLRTNSDLCHLHKNWLVFATEMKSVCSAVRTGPLNAAACAPSFNLLVTRCINKFKIQQLYVMPTLYLCVV
jgi:hypothetical protein